MVTLHPQAGWVEIRLPLLTRGPARLGGRRQFPRRRRVLRVLRLQLLLQLMPR